MTKKQLALEVIDRLKKEYPDAGCTLDYDEAWKLLVSVRLAAQCTDARVNVVVAGLFEKYPSVAALAGADVDDIEKLKLQEEEVEKVGWFSIDEIKKMNDEGEFFRNHYEEFEVLMDWLKKSE